MVILAIRHIYLHFIMTYTYIISIEFSHMMNDYMVHMAPPPSFTHVYRHIYGRVEHRHSCHTALSRGLVDQHSYYRYH